MNGIIARYKKAAFLALVSIMSLNGARAEKNKLSEKTLAAVQAAKAAVDAVQTALLATTAPMAHDAGEDVANLVATNLACASCTEGVAQVSLQDGLEASLAAAVEDALDLVSIDEAAAILNAIELHIQGMPTNT